MTLLKNPQLMHKADVLNALDSDRHHGLTTEAVEQKRATDGPNRLPQPPKPNVFVQFMRSFKEPLVIILLVAVGLSILSAVYDFSTRADNEHGWASVYEAIAIFLLIIINASLSFWQERKAERSMAALQAMTAHEANVLRDDQWQPVPADELVVGDIVELKTGDLLDADVRLLQAHELQVNESHLTGEADVIDKQTHALVEDKPLAERNNLAFSGSMVTHGSAIAIVVATGANTELGKIAGMIANTATTKTPIERNVAKLSKRLLYVALAIVTGTLLLEMFKFYQATGTLSFQTLAESLSSAIALAVAAIPDAMPAVLSIVLTIGAAKLARNNGLIKSLGSVETLGATNFIASDKTGTLTQNQMTVTHFWTNGARYTVEGSGYAPVGEIVPEDTGNAPDYTEFISAAVLNNTAELRPDEDGREQPFGNPTDIALMILGQKVDVTQQSLATDGPNKTEIVRIFPFDSDRKMMSVVVKTGSDYAVLAKGAPDVLLTRTKNLMEHGELLPIASEQDRIERVIADYANSALRTIAVARRDLDETTAKTASVEELEQNLTLIGIAGIIDPPRPEVKKSVKTLHEAGVAVAMITGDHALTARAIAKKIGIVNSSDAPVLTGADIDTFDEDQLATASKDVRVFARVTPAHKQRIVRALQSRSKVMAMTGDGINDAPALRAADIGIAMGINGTTVTKDAADLILLDDKFTTIERAVRAGRTIFGTIRNFMRHELITNVAEVLALLLGTVFITQAINNVPATTPTLTALMVLWVNMISDALPSFALGYDDPESDVMRQAPRNVNDSILKGLFWRIAIRGTVMGGLVFAAFIWAATAGYGVKEAQTIAFLTLVFGQLWHVFDARSNLTLFRRNPFDNGRLLLAVGFAGASSLLVTLLPFFNTVMGTTPLSAELYLAVIFIPALPTFILSGLKELALRVNHSSSSNKTN